mmetsp:Transcript_5550/g.9849  ORF Transcript_5550/g.9849 Transcript_5550/m.9849 type:complete len:81 (+) Transcript_5550:2599-2841(+)
MGVIVQYHSSPGLLFGCHEAFLDDIPVDNVPNGLDVIRTDIFVVELEQESETKQYQKHVRPLLPNTFATTHHDKNTVFLT